MPNSSWRNTWREDLYRVLCTMSPAERAGLQRWGLETAEGRRLFVNAARRLDLDIAYTAYLMQETALAAPPPAVSVCPGCGRLIESKESSYLAVSATPADQPGGPEDLLFCEACARASAQTSATLDERTA